jgi:rubrerythrin
MERVDSSPDRAETYTYECESCGRRMEASHQPMQCPVCGGDMQNISRPREQ